MSTLTVNTRGSFNIKIDSIASDKSISHRCAIFSLLSNEPSYIKNYLQAEDTLNTLNIVKKLGAKIEKKGEVLIITPPKKIKETNSILDCGNSGTAMRLFMGYLSSQDGFFVLYGDKYLASRPMKRVSLPLQNIGANIDGVDRANLAPIAIRGAKLRGFDYSSPISSAQVKSAMILAALNADEVSTFCEPTLSRDHSERMLRGMGADIVGDKKIQISPLKKPLRALNIKVPSDPSSGFFFAIAAAITPNSSVTLQNISLNPTRIEAYKILQKMGADVTFIKKEDEFEPIGDIIIKHKELKAVVVEKNISWLIDELPALSIAMANAKGVSIVKNAKELRVKESDRISSVVKNLQKCSVKVKENEDGYEIMGSNIKGATIDSYGDHRVAMSFAIAGINSYMIIKDIDCIKTSFPNFIEILKNICEVEVGD